MNKTINFLQLPKFPVDTQVMDDMISMIAFLESVIAKVATSGDSLIISGCVVSNNTISSGIVYYDGKIMPFAGGDWFGPDDTAIDFEATTTQVTADSVTYDVVTSYSAFPYEDDQAAPGDYIASFKRLHQRVKVAINLSATGSGYTNSMTGTLMITEHGSVTIRGTIAYSCTQDPNQATPYEIGILSNTRLVDGNLYHFPHIAPGGTPVNIIHADGLLSIEVPAGNQTLIGTIKTTLSFNIYE
jgi:hypothetical protein